MAILGGILAGISFVAPMVMMVFINEKRFDHFKKRLAVLERKTAWIQVTESGSTEAQCQIVQRPPVQ